MELSTESSCQAQVKPPKGRIRDAREQESPATLLRLGISPHTTPETHVHYSLSSSRSQGKSGPLHEITLSARAHGSRKGSKKVCRLSDSSTWAQTGRTQEILSHSQCWSSDDGCPHKGEPSPALKLYPGACLAPVQHLESLDSAQEEIPKKDNAHKAAQQHHFLLCSGFLLIYPLHCGSVADCRSK